jgi:hypothetical protein
MDNPETLPTLGTQDIGTKTGITMKKITHKAQHRKLKKRINTILTKNRGEHRCSQRWRVPMLLIGHPPF